MKLNLTLICAGWMALMAGTALAAPDGLGETSTDWKGIKFQIIAVKRIPGDRLLFGIKVQAAQDAPQTTAMFTRVPIPPGVNVALAAPGTYGTAPFSLGSAVMTDEASKQDYKTMKPDPTGPNYLPGEMSGVLHPGQADVLTIQFPIPPPPQAGSDGTIPKQTVSLLLPKAKGPITQIVIPPAAAAAANSHP